MTLNRIKLVLHFLATISVIFNAIEEGKHYPLHQYLILSHYLPHQYFRIGHIIISSQSLYRDTYIVVIAIYQVITT